MKRFVIIGTVVASSLALAACTTGSGDNASTPSDKASPTAVSSPSESTPAKAATTEPAAQQGELTPPGTTLALGESAVTHVNSGKDPSDPTYKEAQFTIAVSRIDQGSPDDLQVFQDASKFAGQTPYYIFTDVTLDSLSAPSAGISMPRVAGLLSDGTEAQHLIAMGSFDKCPNGSLDTEGDGDAFSYKVGSSTTTCTIYLAPTGDSITAAQFTDSGFTYAKYGDNPYLDNPITWK